MFAINFSLYMWSGLSNDWCRCCHNFGSIPRLSPKLGTKVEEVWLQSGAIKGISLLCAVTAYMSRYYKMLSSELSALFSDHITYASHTHLHII